MAKLALEGPILLPGQDALRRAPHVDAIVRFLADESVAGFAVSLEGSWGSGKTSILNLVIHELKAMGELAPVIVPFSPWLVGDSSSLAREFLRQLSIGIAIPRTGEITTQADRLMDVAQKLLKYSRYVPGVGPFREDLKDLEDAIGASREVVKAMDAGAAAERMDVNHRKKDVVAALASLGRQVVVVLDDVDRLAPKDVYEVIRLVRAVADFPSVRYILAMDPAYVESALDKCGVSNAANFLDKIFFHRFVVPPVFPEQVDALLRSRLQELVQSRQRTELMPRWEERLDQLVQAGLTRMLTTLRDVKVVANRVQLQLGLADEVNLSELVALESLAVKAPSVHRQIIRSPDFYSGATRHFGDDASGERLQASEATRLRAVEEVPIELRDAVRSVLARVFDEGSIGIEQGGLTSPSRLRIAVSGTVPRSDIRLRDVRAFIVSPADREEIADEVCRLKGLARFSWLLTKAFGTRELNDAPDALARFGKLVDHPAAQDMLLGDSDARDVVRRMFLMLRGAAYLRPEAILRGDYGVTQSYWELQLWAVSNDVRIHGLDSEWNRPNEWELQRRRSEHPNEVLLPDVGSIWPDAMPALLRDGRYAHLAYLREVCKVQRRLILMAAGDQPEGYSLPRELWSKLSDDIDRSGRRYHTFSGRIDPARLAAILEEAERSPLALRPYQRASLLAAQQPRFGIYEDNLSVVPLENVLPRAGPDIVRDWLAPY